MLFPIPVLAPPSAPWHIAHFALNTGAPSAAANAELANAKVATRTEDLIFMVLHFLP
jgi:hypothetical protein